MGDLNVYLELMSVIRSLKYSDLGPGEHDRVVRVGGD